MNIAPYATSEFYRIAVMLGHSLALKRALAMARIRQQRFY
jgi:hypothetical protein